MEVTQEEIQKTVSSLFDITKTEISLTKMKFRFRNIDFKENFVKLTQILESRNLVCILEKHGDVVFLVVSKFPPLKQRKWLSKTWTPRILFAVTVAMVLTDGFFRTAGLNSFMPIGDPFGVAILYAWALIGILGVHEAGHLIAAKWHKIKTTWPYFIPGVPIFGIPTFGAYTSPVIDSEIAEQMFGTSQLIQMNENLIMMGMLELFDKNGEDVEIIMSPIMFAAWLGFLITFLNLLPAWQLDGGHMSRVILGQKWHKIATYASMGVLVLLNYWMMAILILILSSRSKDAQPLDDISPLSKNRKIIYIGVIVLAILCAPLPNSIFP